MSESTSQATSTSLSGRRSREHDEDDQEATFAIRRGDAPKEDDDGDEIVLVKKKTIDTNNKLAKATSSSSTTTTQSAEYNATIPVTTDGLLLFLGKAGQEAGQVCCGWPGGSVVFLRYRRHPDGSKGPAELNNLIHRGRDRIIVVDGTSIIGKPFKQVVTMLTKKRATQKFITLRFQEYKSEKEKRLLADDDKMENGDSGDDSRKKPKWIGDHRHAIVNFAGDDDDSNNVEDVTEQCFKQRHSKRKIIELSSSDDEQDVVVDTK